MQALNLDNITILDIFLVMVATGCAMILLAWYFTKVLSTVTGIPQPIFFPLTVSPRDQYQVKIARETDRRDGTCRYNISGAEALISSLLKVSRR